MAREPTEWVRTRRHPKAKGLYVYVDESTLTRANIPEELPPGAVIIARRYVLGKGDVLVRFRVSTPSKWDMDLGYVTKARKPGPRMPEEEEV